MCAFPTALPLVSCASGEKEERAALHHPLLPLGTRKPQKCASSALQEQHQKSAMENEAPSWDGCVSGQGRQDGAHSPGRILRKVVNEDRIIGTMPTTF